jgi:acyl dehydratase
VIDGLGQVWYEDLAVGQRYQSAAGILVTEADILEFARRFDPQPGHADPAAAEHSFFGGLAASGWHTAAVTMRLLADVGFPIGNGIVGAGVELRWPTPTRPGDELRLTLEVMEKRLSRSKPDRGIVIVEYDTRNQAGQWRQHTRTTLIVFRRPAGSPAGGR